MNRMAIRRQWAILWMLLICAGCAPRLIVLAEYRSPVSDAEWASEACQRPAGALAADDSTTTRFLRVYVGSCEPGGRPPLAQALRDHRFSRDTAALDELARQTSEFVDSAVFAAAIEIARDPDASTEARVSALRTLIYTLQPGSFVTLAQLASRSCFGHGPGFHTSLGLGAPLPGDHVSRIRELGATLRDAPSNPPGLRNAAACAWVRTEHRLRRDSA
jgi:hypothetical protein